MLIGCDDNLKVARYKFYLRAGTSYILDCCVNSDDLEAQLHRYLLKTILTDLGNAVFSVYATDVMMAAPDDKEFTPEVNIL